MLVFEHDLAAAPPAPMRRPGITALRRRPLRMPPASAEQIRERNAEWHLEVAGSLDVAGDREDHRAAGVRQDRAMQTTAAPLRRMVGTEAKL